MQRPSYRFMCRIKLQNFLVTIFRLVTSGLYKYYKREDLGMGPNKNDIGRHAGTPKNITTTIKYIRYKLCLKIFYRILLPLCL